MTVDLKQEKNRLSGMWDENNQYNANLTGILTDSCIVFENTAYKYNDHYNAESPNSLDFRKSFLKLDMNNDTVYLTGNLYLYSTKQKEPEKPIFIILIKDSEKKSIIPEVTKTAEADIILNYIAFPNPFTDAVQVKYVLRESETVRFVMTRVLTGKTVFNGTSRRLGKGENSEKFSINAPSGWYVLTQYYGNKHRSSLLYKN
ncbi:hypothetical protein [Pedobacter miscanthi]|uniref:hypothetical protein n=1 Tax=Pedobacter miscanthi TaxID=2259170 RepID=UPI002930AA4C|nr:hypothetical protein [Pedobacter miscanthi]